MNEWMSEATAEITVKDLARHQLERAQAIARADGIDTALESGALPRRVDVTLSETLVPGLCETRIRKRQ